MGKAHLGAIGTSGEDPAALGFDVNIAGHGAGAPASYHGTESFRRGGVWDVPGLEAWHDRDIFLTEVLALEASAAVRQSVGDGVPFFLHMAPYAVHTPITANARYIAHYQALPSREAAYASMIETVDAALGTLLDLLDELDVAKDTLVVFTSDNGGLSAHAPRVDGRDLTALLMGEEQAEGDLEPRDLLWHQPHYWGDPGPGIEPFSALRSGDWKLIHRHADGGLELYDLAHDPDETTDLAADQPARVATLARRLGEALRAADAQRSRDAATGAPIDWPDADS